MTAFGLLLSGNPIQHIPECLSGQTDSSQSRVISIHLYLQISLEAKLERVLLLLPVKKSLSGSAKSCIHTEFIKLEPVCPANRRRSLKTFDSIAICTSLTGTILSKHEKDD